MTCIMQPTSGRAMQTVQVYSQVEHQIVKAFILNAVM